MNKQVYINHIKRLKNERDDARKESRLQYKYRLAEQKMYRHRLRNKLYWITDLVVLYWMKPSSCLPQEEYKE